MLSADILLNKDFLDGDMGVAKGTVKELHPHPYWLSPVIPNMGFPGGPSKALWGTSCCLRPLEIPPQSLHLH